MSGEFTIYFDGKLWLGLFSVEKEGKVIRIGKYIFGKEPSSAEVYEWLCKGAPGLVMNEVDSKADLPFVIEKRKNPKRVLREVRKSQAQGFDETLAQRCMREQVEQFKKVSKKSLREKRREHEQKIFEMKAAKRKEKHRGH